MQTCRSINTYNPELAKVPLPCFPIAVGKLPPTLHCFACPTIQLPARSTIPLRMV